MSHYSHFRARPLMPWLRVLPHFGIRQIGFGLLAAGEAEGDELVAGRAVIIDDKAVSELNRDGARMLKRHACDHLRMQRVIDVHCYQFAVSRNVGVASCHDDVVRAR